ncbi:hypothetical protein R50073_36790 [Maricurvus nonylphenolicus]
MAFKFGAYKSHRIHSVIPGFRITSEGISFPVIVSSHVKYERSETKERFIFSGNKLITYNTQEIVN